MAAILQAYLTMHSNRAFPECTSGKYCMEVDTSVEPFGCLRCRPATKCRDDQYERLQATATGDRQCSSKHSGRHSCPEGHFESAPAIDHVDTCWLPRWNVGCASGGADRVCTPLRECNFLDEYESVQPFSLAENEARSLWGIQQRGNDRQCSPLTVCDSNLEFELVAKTGSTDRVCKPATVCDAMHEYEVYPLSAGEDRECAAATVCGLNEIEAQALAPTRDRHCVTLDCDGVGR